MSEAELLTEISELEREAALLSRQKSANTDAILGDENTSMGFIGHVNARARIEARLSDVEAKLSSLREELRRPKRD